VQDTNTWSPGGSRIGAENGEGACLRGREKCKSACLRAELREATTHGTLQLLSSENDSKHHPQKTDINFRVEKRNAAA
jgi:hypothetical protein